MREYKVEHEGDEWDVKDWSFEDAAKKIGDKSYWYDGGDPDDFREIYTVTDVETGESKQVKVTAEAVVVFKAQEV